MKIFRKPIFTGFAPNLTTADVLKAISFLLLPWKWTGIRNGKNIQQVEQKLSAEFSAKHCVVFDSGRSALYFILKGLGTQPGDEIMLQAFTCVVVPNAIIGAGGKPVYVDTNVDFNLDTNDLEKKITHKTKAIIIQHTFGRPADVNFALNLAKKYRLTTVEDCAHALGVKYHGKSLGTFADTAFFSFGSDKPVSCGRGGAIITNNDELAGKLRQFQSTLPPAKIFKTIQHLLHFIIFAAAKPLYNLGVGKCALWCAKHLNLINKIIYPEEKRGKAVSFYPSQMANCLANILLGQLRQIDGFNAHREKIARMYQTRVNNPKVSLPADGQSVSFLRYPILVDDPNALRRLAKRNGIILGDWYDCPVAPKDIDVLAAEYQMGSCQNAEKLSSRVVNLPTDTHISEKDALRIIKLVNSF
ncbi:MAG: DegT/DnrJ/EryC1/StrS aminotransferase family protein [Candidatus Magasanikbacteria bacterium]|nr:DegT/DnrJ/EryC1/StrS aminotransferase family protein [Candidatus Magasanikbacteria bacterium]